MLGCGPVRHGGGPRGGARRRGCGGGVGGEIVRMLGVGAEVHSETTLPPQGMLRGPSA
jgi:hypothetical protein